MDQCVCVAFPALDARLAGYKVYAVIPKFRYDLKAILAPKACDAWINPASPAAEVEPLLAVRLEVGLGQGPI